jgi:DNA-binding response OmpR family regulator
MMTSVDRRTGRLLIVDDDEGVTQTFAGILRLEGHQVRTASNAFEGLKEVESFRPDAIILDLRMPLINGLGFLYRLRGVVCTIDEESTNELRALGAHLWLKPLWTEDLISIANSLLKSQSH